MREVARKCGLCFVLLVAVLLVAACSASPAEETPEIPVETKQPATSFPTPIIETDTPSAQSSVAVATTSAAIDAPEPPPAPTPAPTPTPITYTVQAGDLLSIIARNHGVTLEELSSENGITDPNAIQAGLVLTIPNVSSVPDDAGAQISLTTYKVRRGDTLAGIAGFYGVSVYQLAAFNGLSLEAALLPDKVLNIPLEGHVVMPDDTLIGIAKLYGVSMDGLIALNAGEYPSLPVNPGNILQGWLLKLPQETVAEGYNCDPEPGVRTGTIEHVLEFNMELACLSSKFGVSVNTLAWANQDVIISTGLQDGVTLHIPPADGAIYTVSENDIASETTVEDLMTWYDISDPNDVRDGEGNPVSGSLDEAGQQLFIAGADLLDGPYEPRLIVLAPPSSGVPVVGEDGIIIPPTEGGGLPGYIFGQGDPPPGTLRPKTIPWIGTTILDTGYCNVVQGSGFGTPLVWPVDGPSINPNRSFDEANHHRGIDINANIGSPVYAAAGGVVVWAGNSVYGYGNLVVLDHGESFQTFYAHLDSVYVSCGQTVGPGEIIATSGQTGLSTWPHVHFELRFGGFNYDPRLYLP